MYTNQQGEFIFCVCDSKDKIWHGQEQYETKNYQNGWNMDVEGEANSYEYNKKISYFVFLLFQSTCELPQIHQNPDFANL